MVADADDFYIPYDKQVDYTKRVRIEQDLAPVTPEQRQRREDWQNYRDLQDTIKTGAYDGHAYHATRPPINPYWPGDRVWIAEGHWKNRVGIVKTIEKEATFLQLEGTLTHKWIHVADLDPIKG